MLATADPVLITQPWKKVPVGTNGGVTVWGFTVSAIGGALMGISTILMDGLSNIRPIQTEKAVFFGTVCGVVGSAIDSVLGATVQATYFDPETKLIHHENGKGYQHIVGANVISNVGVNVLSIAATCLLGGFVFGPLIYS